jgi:hypothetical protein
MSSGTATGREEGPSSLVRVLAIEQSYGRQHATPALLDRGSFGLAATYWSIMGIGDRPQGP